MPRDYYQGDRDRPTNQIRVRGGSAQKVKMESSARLGLQSAMKISFIIVIASSIICVQARSQRYVTCGSVIKLLNVDYKVRLHSHDVKYGTGSGQQSVTGTEAQEDVNSHWTIKGETKKFCTRGEAVKCGDVIRLQHLATLKNLHSHQFSSPLSGNQEVSAYGDDDGEGDTGDHWTVQCNTDFWVRDEPVKFRHVDTSTYLAVSGRTYGRPISGQTEVVALTSPGGHVEWTAAEGLYIHATELPQVKEIHHGLHHTEL